MSVVEEIYRKNPKREPITSNMRRRGILSLTKSLTDSGKEGRHPVIAEFKRSSPSGFSIPHGMEMHVYFEKILHFGISGISVLTEPDYFHGSYSDLLEASVLDIPVLAKDFISSREMILSSYYSGADAILLIADFLSEEELRNLSGYAMDLGLEVVTEFHSISMLEKCKPYTYSILGYNRRNLSTMQIEDETETVITRIKGMPGIKILESGLDYTDIPSLYRENFSGFLIGTSMLNRMGAA